MTRPDDTIRVVIPLTIRKRNGRPKILPPEGVHTMEDRSQDPHILKALGRGWAWRRKLESGEMSAVHEIASEQGISERYVSRIIRLAYLAPSLIERMTVQQLPAKASLKELINSSADSWALQKTFLTFQRDESSP